MLKDLKTILDYRYDLKCAKEYVDSESRRADKWMNFSYDLQAKLDVALDRLETIAEGRHYPIESGNAENKDRITAAVGLKKIARMQERKA